VIWYNLLLDLVIILILILGIYLFRYPKPARTGNIINAFALFAAFALVLWRHDIFHLDIIVIAILAGSLVGTMVALRVNAVQIPAMIAFQHGAGGIAAFLVSFIELYRLNVYHNELIGQISGILGLIIGAATFSGSMIASGKLANKINQRPTILPHHSTVLLGLAILVISIGLAALWMNNPIRVYLLLVLIFLSILLGVVFAIRIGGADMPVLISLLNATAGLAGAFCGIIIQNRLLIACGATVAASGSILTHIMCVAMNRSLPKVLIGQAKKLSKETISKEDRLMPDVQKHTKPKTPPADPYASATDLLKKAKKVVIIPGYGMALAQAQFIVTQMSQLLEQKGVDVKFAIHPVAGRMPGHMNVLLAEANVNYDKLVEMDIINSDFPHTDVALIIGSCDVVNPAAIQQEGTPISGMPILMALEARSVIVCNLDDKPGYSGVENPLYKMDKTIMLLGDAKTTLEKLLKGMQD